MTTTSSMQPSARTAGRLLSLIVLPVGVALWVTLWNFGFMASLVAFAIAYGAIWLFEFGAKSKPARSDVLFLIGVIAAGVILSFLGGMVSDAWYAWTTEFNETAGFFSADFWSFVTANLTSGELWGSYIVDLLIALVFAVLGAGSLVRDLFAKDDSKSIKNA